MIGGSVTEKITPETYEKMNEGLKRKVLLSESLFLHKKKLMIGDNGTKYLKPWREDKLRIEIIYLLQDLNSR